MFLAGMLTACRVDEFDCGNGTCIAETLVCNRVKDCPDNSDETNCGKYNNPVNN